VKRLVDLLESAGCSAAFFFTRHLRINPVLEKGGETCRSPESTVAV
jgi:hypothetical protein